MLVDFIGITKKSESGTSVLIETSYPGRYSSGKKVVVVGSIYFLFLVAGKFKAFPVLIWPHLWPHLTSFNFWPHGLGTFVFQHIEKEGVEQRCSVAMNKTNEYKVNGLSNFVMLIDIFTVKSHLLTWSKVPLYGPRKWRARNSLEKEQMIASNFYRFGYNIKACEKLSQQLKRNDLIQHGLSDLKSLWKVSIWYRLYYIDYIFS